MAHRYVPSGKSDPNALLIIAAASIGAGIVAGVIDGLVSQYFSLFILFPLALGLVVGAVGDRLITSKRFRRPVAALMIGLVGGAMAQSTVRVVRYEVFRGAVAENMAQDPEAKALIEHFGASGAVDAVLTHDGAALPFLGYLSIAAKQGITVAHFGSTGKGPAFTGGAAYAIWLAEILIAAGVAAAMLRSQAKEPFCEACEGWTTHELRIGSGRGDKKSVIATVAEIEGGRFAEAARSVGVGTANAQSVYVLRQCAEQTHDRVLEARILVAKKNKAETKVISHTVVTASEAKELADAILAAQSA
jgi:hypothetical protein